MRTLTTITRPLTLDICAGGRPKKLEAGTPATLVGFRRRIKLLRIGAANPSVELATSLTIAQESEPVITSHDPTNCADREAQDDVQHLPPISPWALASGTSVIRHDSAPIRQQRHYARTIHRVPRAQEGEPSARRVAPGSQQKGDLVPESATQAGGNDGSSL